MNVLLDLLYDIGNDLRAIEKGWMTGVSRLRLTDAIDKVDDAIKLANEMIEEEGN